MSTSNSTSTSSSTSSEEWIYESPDNGKTVYRRKAQEHDPSKRELVLSEHQTLDEKIATILNQTEYTEEQARAYLQEYDNDEIAVIRYYLTGSACKVVSSKAVTSKNQLVYSEIRKFMDGCVKPK